MEKYCVSSPCILKQFCCMCSTKNVNHLVVFRGGVAGAVPIILSAVYFACQYSSSFFLWLVSWMINFSASCISADWTASVLSWFSFSKTLSDMLDTHKNDRTIYAALSR